jgi:hypothetical protein
VIVPGEIIDSIIDDWPATHVPAATGCSFCTPTPTLTTLPAMASLPAVLTLS